ncbi:HAD family phosphatase [Sphingomonas sp. LHG3406-1]|uniref:HAD family hydrolase n=1 Tax=Sphingomonas sp. LHG3406-1 TaxID=2804617 RepID=UPI0026375A2B|nr:HAD-IB family hydrolase [Sphingomonas sp. LHG3406-1]
MDLAIYDMDRTVTRRPTYTSFLLHCAIHRAPWRLVFLPVVVGSMLFYVVKLISRATLKEVNHRLLIGQSISLAEMKPLVDSFADRQAATNIRPGARAAIRRDKEQGRRVVMATASYRFYAAAIAERVGFDDVIGTNTMLGLDDSIICRIEGENCYGEAKMRMVADWVEKSGLTGKHGHVRFYSDHVTDAPVFEWADEAVAVNPHGRLRELATKRGWAVVDWG